MILYFHLLLCCLSDIYRWKKNSDIYVLYLRDKRESVETDVHTSASGVQKQNLYSLIQLLLIWNNVSYTNKFLQLNTKEIE